MFLNLKGMRYTIVIDTRVFFNVLKRSTLLDPEFNKILKDNHFLVWGGDIRDYEGSQGITCV